MMKTYMGILASLAILGYAGCASQNQVSRTQNIESCPLSENAETADDCPWAGLTRNLLKNPLTEGLPAALQERSPVLYQSLIEDLEDQNALSFWGLSQNYDAGAKATIVDLAIIKGLLSMARLPAPADPNEQVVHAGVEHTYGYLLSNLKTSFGFKRQRWVRGDLESGFGLPDLILHPHTRDGGFLRNISYFLGRIAFRDKAVMRPTLEAIKAAEVLKSFPFESLKIKRLSETIQVNESRSVTVATDLVSMTKPAKDRTLVNLLVYSYEDSASKTPFLISGFPITQKALDDLLNAYKPGADQLIKPRYNVYIPGVSDSKKDWKGRRQLQ